MEKIALVEFKALNVTLTTDSSSTENENIFSLDTHASYSEENDKLLEMKLEMKLNSVDGFTIHVDYVGYFESGGSITDEFKNGLFVKINAPSILYPYLRSFVSNLSINAGLAPVILPVINFHAIAAEAEKEIN